ncbi:MAG: hypothetical protein SCARUB_03012 [Candidatus Scalindua rubra]|uniref:Uncharacterized protein n=1 Tax=Candidatus Scalindua rubra TaxID=1872076 RepID=A0A1E3X8A5_9BACT|nr:MAG: hypothetical protein SCARUB_03012 [Candidatus Scalindua rubra]
MNEITKDYIIQTVRQVANSKGQNWLTNKEFFDASDVTTYQFRKHFLRWNDAITAAGLTPLGKRGRPHRQRGYKKEELIVAVQNLAAKLKRDYVSITEFTKQTVISDRPIYRIFGTWEQFVREAGLNLHPAHKQKIPDESLFKEFFRITSQFGHFPSYKELNLAKYSSGTFEGRFGTYSDFKIHALQYGLKHGLVEPDIANQEQAKPSRKQNHGVSYEQLNDRPVLGHRIDFHGLLHAPVNELGVVYLFGILSQELGFVVESMQAGFPDCQAKRRLPKDRWQSVRIEFEFKSSNFIGHRHNLTQCDMIVCWEHDWTDCPIKVISLKDIVEKKKA